MKPNLGHIVTLVEREVSAVTAFFEDPITRASGCADEFAPSVGARASTRVELLLRRHGYGCYDEFVTEVEARTSPRWVYFESSLLFFHGDNGAFFEQRVGDLEDQRERPDLFGDPLEGERLYELERAETERTNR